MKQEGLPLVIFGTGDTAAEAAYLVYEINQSLDEPNYHILGFVGAAESEIGKNLGDYKIISSDSLFADFAKKYEQLAVIIPMADWRIKQKICRNLSELRNLSYPNLIHPAVNLRGAKLGRGNLIQADVTISIHVEMGNFNLINYQSFIGHDVQMGDFCVCSPHSTICGHVKMAGGVFVGASATVLQGLCLDENTIIGAGAVLTKDAKGSKIWTGIPASPRKGKE